LARLPPVLALTGQVLAGATVDGVSFGQVRFSFKSYTPEMPLNNHSLLRLALLLLLLQLAGCATLPPARPDNVCSIFQQKRGWHSVATKAEKKWGTSMHIAMAIMNQESAFKSKARPPRGRLLGFIPWRRPSSAYGYAQVIDGTWRDYKGATGDYWRKRNNFADATDFVHWYMNEANKRNKVARTDAYNLYLNYHEGPAGFRRGTYKKKKWLAGVALKVQRRSEAYRAQYAGCKDNFKPGFFGRLLGR